MPDLELITAKEAAARLKIHFQTIYNWIGRGELRSEHGLVRIGRRTRLDWAALQAAVKEGRLMRRADCGLRYCARCKGLIEESEKPN